METTDVSRTATVLVLGAYGLAGHAITRMLLERTPFNVSAAGRKAAALAQLFSGSAALGRRAAELPDTRLRTVCLDARDTSALATACGAADVVINEVGPYARDGASIARTVIEAGKAYIDFANEQMHFHRLEALDGLAREQGVPLITAAGAIPGVSTMLALHAAARVPGVERLDLFWAQGRMPEAGSGLGSLMSGVLEAHHMPVAIEDGEETPIRLGARWHEESLPPPFGKTKMLGLPTIDAITIPRLVPLRHLQTWWMMGDVPTGLLTLLRVLRPERRPWAYRLVEALVRKTAEREYAHALAHGLGPEGLLKVRATGPDSTWEGHILFRDGGVATAVLPVLCARAVLEGRAPRAGLLTPPDLFTPEDVFKGLEEAALAVEIGPPGNTR
jgi:hypothetical protein